MRQTKLRNVVLALFAIASFPASAVDWSQVNGKTITLFYTGLASWEWMLTQAEHSGAKDMRVGKACAACHGDEQIKIGNTIASGIRLEPAPPTGVAGSIKAEIKFAYDAERLYVQVNWPASDKTLGQPMDPEHVTKMSMMLDDGTLKEARLGGCWGTCHDDLRRMASDTEELDLTKYIIASREKVTRKGGGMNIKDESALAALVAKGKFFEYWQARVDKQGKGHVIDGYILERRHENATAAVSGDVTRQGDHWVATLSRPLQAPSDTFKTLAPGKDYMVGFAIHTGHADGRYHHVSLETSLRLGKGSASFIAKKLP